MHAASLEVPAVVLVDLTHEELLERCDELSAVLEQMEAVRNEKSSALADFKERLTPLEARERELHRQIRTRQEERPAQQKLFDGEDSRVLSSVTFKPAVVTAAKKGGKAAKKAKPKKAAAP